MGKTFMLTFYFGLVSSIFGRPSNTNSEPDRSRSPSGLDSIRNTHHIIKELTNNDNVLINYSDGSEDIVNNLNFQNMSAYEQQKNINGKLEIKLQSKCHENTYNEKKINEKIYINLPTKLQDILKFDVIHDIFDTKKGLNYGLVYKVRLEAVSSTKLKSFIIKTVSQDGISIGNFFSYNSYSQLPFSWIQTRNFENIPQEPEDQKLKDDDSTCLNNIWSGDFKNKSTAIAFWISNQFFDSVNATEFRCLVKLKGKEGSLDVSSDTLGILCVVPFSVPLQISTFITLRKCVTANLVPIHEPIVLECNLWLKNSSGTVDHTFLPLYSLDCKINFPSFDEVSFSQPPEYLIKLNRLNIPCDSGSYIQFTSKQKMCGKLEELNENELTYYFSIYENISIQIFKNAVFSLHYNLVDYCYNKTVTEMNSTFYIKPIRDSLECYIKIHLPYGNKINVTIVTNYANSELINDFDEINFEHVLKNSNFSKANVNDLVKANYSSSLCDGIFIAFIEGDYIQWHNCVQERNKIKQFSYISTSNILVIHAKKYSVIEKFGDVILNTNILPSVLLTYKFESIPEIVADCAYGWISIQPFCITTVEKTMTWEDGEEYCSTIGGHLASIRTESDQKLIDEMIQNSPKYHKYFAYWIGGSDKRLEGEYKWSDGLPFQYSNWFPGWSQHNHYNKQPNDDGLSNQDCIELRKHFRTPPGIRQSPAVPFSESFMWNDRDCDTKNYIVCESEIFENKLKSSWMNDCNKTVTLTNESPKASIWSPSFPRQYPDNANCYTTITAPKGYKIVVEFEELVTENEPGCSYDFLEITESIGYQDNKHRDDEHIPNQSKFVQFWNKYGNRDPYEHFISSNNQELVQTIYQNLLFSTLYKPQFNYLIRTPNYPKGNILYQNNTSQEYIPEKICGDWSSKLKLLRYVSRNTYLGFHFVSDYSHNFGGYKAKVFIENSESECTDNRLTSYNNFCYLFVSYPEVDWWTAQQICKGMGAQLTSVSAISEHRFITTSIRNQADYTPQALYWLGAEFVHSGEFEWTDNTKMSFQGWYPGDDSSGISFTDSTCLGLQWKKSTTSTSPSGLYWKPDKCRKLGGYICKRKRPHYKYFELRNETVFGTEGRLTSPGYPGLYPVNTDYWIHIVAAERSRIIVQFQKIDLEPQDECLYDFISIQNYDQVSKILLEPGVNIIPMAMLKSEGNMESNQYERDRMYFLHRSRRSYNNDRAEYHILAKSKNIKHLSNKFQSFSHIKYRKNISFKWRNIKRNYKRDIVSQIKQSSPSFLPYVRWCGQHDSNMSKFDFVSISNEIIINFHSDYSTSGVGFAAVWKTIDMSGCPKQSFTSPEGTVSSPNYPHFLINNIDCTYVIQAPNGKRVRLEFQDFDILEETVVYIDIGSNVFQPYLKKNHINEGIFVSLKEQIKIQIKTAQKPRGKGFQAIYKTVGSTIQERVIHLSNYTKGYLYRLNYPEKVPENIFFSQHLIAPLGDIILLEIYDVEFSTRGCLDNNKIEVFDYYADNNGTKWILCKNTKNQNTFVDNSRKSNNSEHELAPVHITSYMNTIHVLQSTTDNTFLNFNATIRIEEDELVESCQHHPCLHNGKCKTHGNRIKCECYGHFTGRFCALNLCEVEPCIFGKCELTLNNFKCHCQPGYIGPICDQKQNPCADNPCEGRGECFVKNGVFTCRCHAWWEGRKCERRMLHIPYKPLSERMLQEPFWLGLITVFIVLAFIGLVWCAKRHFPEKIEKLLAEEADRNRPPGSVSGHHHTSLREQLQFTSSIPQGTSINLHGPSRSIFNRLGIRKPSLLSLSSPYPSAGATARTFSLDDLLQPLPLRSPSRRTKRNNSTPVKKNAAEKKQILQQLVFPIMKSSPAKLNLDEIIQMSENNLKEENTTYFYNEDKETNKLNASPSIPPSHNDLKLEKKVTFARLLNKVSAEMSGGLVMDFTSHGQRDSTASCLATERFMPNSLPTSLSNSDLRLTNDSCNKSNINYNNIPTTSSADSIVAIFRNFASGTGSGNLLPTSSILFSPSATPTPTSPQDYVPGDDDSLTSSINIPVSFSSGPSDAPVFYRTTAIEVPVMDVISAHKTITNTNLLHQPTVHLEIPSNGNNKCLSPIRELPSPFPSPALTPIMPRLHRSITPLTLEDPRATEDSEEIKRKTSVNVITTNYAEMNYFDSDIDIIHSADYSIVGKNENKTFELDDLSADAKTFRPHDLIIPTLLLEQPSPTKNSLPMILFPGSIPPQRAVIIDETSFIFPKKQKRVLQQFDKSTSLDLPFVPPRITITSNEIGGKNDSNCIVSKANVSGTSLLVPENSSGMSYLSPFAMCTGADRTISESNLSSSGYSSMASPGPSRCNSGNPLYSNEMEEPGATQSGSSFPFHSSLFNRGQYSVLSIFKESNNNSNQIGSNGNINQIRLRSDSETLSDDAILESNDEGISTDHIDERNEDSDLSKIKVFENNIEGDIVLSTLKKISTADSSSMEQLQIPIITIHNDGNDKGISPVSSRSESSLSEKAGMCRFSSQFYGQKDHQLPFTDSDGLYDFPSSDGKRVANTHPRRSSSKKRDRKFTKCISIQSPTKSKVDPPIKDSVSKYTSSKHFHSHHSYQAGDISSRKSPKRRQRLPLASSSSSTESLTSARELTININKRLQPTDRENQDQKYEFEQSNGDTSQGGSNNILPNNYGEQQVKLKSKSSRLKAIGNQIRFLRRLEKSIKYREKQQSSECSPEDENSEEFNSLELAYPLLRPTIDNQTDEPCQKHIERISFNNSETATTTTEKK